MGQTGMIDIGALRKCKLLESKNNLYDSLQIPAFLCVLETWQKIIYIPQKFGLIHFLYKRKAGESPSNVYADKILGQYEFKKKGELPESSFNIPIDSFSYILIMKSIWKWTWNNGMYCSLFDVLGKGKAEFSFLLNKDDSNEAEIEFVSKSYKNLPIAIQFNVNKQKWDTLGPIPVKEEINSWLYQLPRKWKMTRVKK